LRWLRVEAGQRVAVEGPVEARDIVSPCLLHLADVLVEAGEPSVHRNVDGVELLPHPSCTDAQDEPAAGYGVDRRQLLGQDDGMAE